MKSVSVPTCVVGTIHGPEGNTLRAIKIVTGCVDVAIKIKSETETHSLMVDRDYHYKHST